MRRLWVWIVLVAPHWASVDVTSVPTLCRLGEGGDPPRYASEVVM